MRERKRQGVIGLMLGEQAIRGQRTHGQCPAIAWIVLKIVNGKKLVSLGKVVIQSQGRKVSGEQSGYVPDKTSQPAVGGVERSRRIRVRIKSIHNVQRDWIEKPRGDAEPAPRTARDDGVVEQLSRRQ